MPADVQVRKLCMGTAKATVTAYKMDLPASHINLRFDDGTYQVDVPSSWVVERLGRDRRRKSTAGHTFLFGKYFPKMENLKTGHFRKIFS